MRLFKDNLLSIPTLIIKLNECDTVKKTDACF